MGAREQGKKARCPLPAAESESCSERELQRARGGAASQRAAHSMTEANGNIEIMKQWKPMASGTPSAGAHAQRVETPISE